MSIDESGVLMSPTIIVCGAMFVLSFSKVSFMNMGTLVFEAYVKDWELLLIYFPCDE